MSLDLAEPALAEIQPVTAIPDPDTRSRDGAPDRRAGGALLLGDSGADPAPGSPESRAAVSINLTGRIEIEGLSCFYGGFRAVRDATLEIGQRIAQLIAGRIAGARVVVLARLAILFKGEIR